MAALFAIVALMLSAVLPAAAVAASEKGTSAARIQLSRPIAAPLDGVSVTGSGFKAGDSVVVYADMTVQGAARRIQATAVANGNGMFAVTFAVPRGTAPGSYQITAKDFHGDSATQALKVLRLVILQVGAKPPAYSVIAGHRFYVRGSGFQPGATVTLTISFPLYNGNSYTENRSVTADQNGAFNDVLMQVPSSAKQGPPALTATGSKSGRKAQAAISVVYQPHATLSATTVVPGSPVTMNGTGFVAGSTVHVSVTIPRSGAATVTLSKDVTADQYGAFSTSFALPSNVRPGTYSVSAVDSVGGFRALASFVVSLHPIIAVKPAAVSPGEAVAIAGGGFTANTSITLSATFPLYGGGTRTVTTTAQTNGSGSFSTHLSVPANAAASTVAVTAQGPNGRASAQLRTRELAASITASPAAALPGSTITVSGSGYLAGAKIDVSVAVRLTNGSTTTLTTSAPANGQGQFRTALHIPANAVGGTYTIVGRSALSGRAPSTRLLIGNVAPSIVAAPAAAVPGSQIAITGSGYLPGAKVGVSVNVKLTNGKIATLSTSATANASGRFTATLGIPANAVGGTYTIVGKSQLSGRAPTARLIISKLAPSIVSVPTTAVPGTPVTINGFGFAPGQTITLSLQGQKVGTATTNAAGRFSVQFTVPSTLASGSYALSAQSSAGRGANITLTVNRRVATHFYFASEYTGAGYHEYLALLNATQTAARVTIVYQRTNGTTLTKTLTVNAHTRATEDVNADLGFHVSAAALVSADVPITASRLVYHGTDGSVVPGVTSPQTVWYFANGNTGKGYREYVAVQNPNSGPVQVAVHFLPTHHKAFTIYRTMPPTSRTTFKINSFVRKDAVGVTITANGPVVANRTIFVHHGMTSKIGVSTLQHTWYFASGPQGAAARNWIGAINPTSNWTYLTLHAYGPLGSEMATVKTWLKPYARVGYLMNKVAHRSDVAVVMTSSRGIVAEQTTYAGRMHNAATDAFGVTAPAKTWQFPATNTLSSAGEGDVLSLFNPNLVPVPIVVQFITASGSVSQRTVVVAPLSHQRIDVGSIVPNQQLGIVAASNYPFVALNRGTFNNGQGAMTSEGIAS